MALLLLSYYRSIYIAIHLWIGFIYIIMLQLHNSLFRNAAMQHLHNAADEGSIRFRLGHFLGFMDVVMSFVAILLSPRHR